MNQQSESLRQYIYVSVGVMKDYKRKLRMNNLVMNNLYPENNQDLEMYVDPF